MAMKNADKKLARLHQGELWEDPHFDLENPEILGKTLAACKDSIKWSRPEDLLAAIRKDKIDALGYVCVYDGSLKLADIRQSQHIGDCWLLSALACVAEYAPARIKGVFVGTRGSRSLLDLAHNGRYELDLYDCTTGTRISVLVDDRLPCVIGRDGEVLSILSYAAKSPVIWPMLIEKAFAKLCGSFSALDGGYSLWALETLIGQHDSASQGYRKDKDKDTWKQLVLGTEITKSKDTSRVTYTPVLTDSTAPTAEFTTEELIQKLEAWLIGETHLVVAMASSEPLAEVTHIDYFTDEKHYVPHAFALLRVEPVTLKDGSNDLLLQLHNPWGEENRWNGKWSDESELWTSEPQVLADMKPARGPLCAGSHGKIWMNKDDFGKIFSEIGVIKCDLGRVHPSEHMPDDMPAWGIKFWESCFSQNAVEVSWVDFKRACQQELTGEKLAEWDKKVKDCASKHGVVAKVELADPSPFLDDVLWHKMGCPDTANPLAVKPLHMLIGLQAADSPDILSACEKLLATCDDHYLVVCKKKMMELSGLLGCALPGTLPPGSPPPTVLLQCFDTWLDKAQRVLVMLAPSGWGKSYFAQHAASANRSGCVQVVHQLEPQDFSGNTTAESRLKGMVCSLAYQLAHHIPAYRASLLEDMQADILRVSTSSVDSLADLLLVNPMYDMEAKSHPESLVLILDGVHVLLHDTKAGSESRLQWLKAKLLGDLPDWVRLVLTGYPTCETDLKQWGKDITIITPTDLVHYQQLMAYVQGKLMKSGFPAGEELGTATRALVQQLQPHFLLHGYSNVSLPGNNVCRPQDRVDRLHEWLEDDPVSGAAIQWDANNKFFMWPEAQLTMLLQYLRFAPAKTAIDTSYTKTWNQPQTVLLHGMFGMGKTTLAQQIKSLAEKMGRKVLWVHIGMVKDTPEARAAAIERCYRGLVENPEVTEKISDLRSRFQGKKLKQHPNMLIILDDAWDIFSSAKDVVEDVINDGQAVQVLITSRSQLPGLTDITRVHLDPAAFTNTDGPDGCSIAETVLIARALVRDVDGKELPHDKRMDYYKEHLKDKPDWQKTITDTSDTGNSILKQCNGCMLAIVMVASLLAKRVEASPLQGLAHWQKTNQDLVHNIRKATVDSTPGDSSESSLQRSTIYGAAVMSIQAVHNQSRPGQHPEEDLKALQAMAMFPSGTAVRLPYCMLVWQALLPQDWSPGRFRPVLCNLSQFSLVFEIGTSYRIHDILADYLLSLEPGDLDFMVPVDLKSLCQAAPLGLSRHVIGTAVIALSGSDKPKKTALDALAVNPGHRPYLAAVGAAQYDNRPQLILVPPNDDLTYPPAIQDLCCRLVVGLVRGNARDVVEPCLDLLDAVGNGTDDTLRQHIEAQVAWRCKGILKQSLVNPPQGVWDATGVDDALCTRVIRSATASENSSTAYVVVSRVWMEIGGGIENNASNMFGAFPWLPEYVTSLRGMLLPWRRSPNRYSTVQARLDKLNELSFSPFHPHIPASTYQAMIELIVDAMVAYPWDEDQWAPGDPGDADSQPADVGWLLVSMEALLKRLVHLILWVPSISNTAARDMFDQVMTAVPYLCRSIMCGWAHEVWGPRTFMWLAHSVEHAYLLSQNEDVLHALRTALEHGRAIPTDTDEKQIICNEAGYALALIELVRDAMAAKKRGDHEMAFNLLRVFPYKLPPSYRQLLEWHGGMDNAGGTRAAGGNVAGTGATDAVEQGHAECVIGITQRDKNDTSK